MGRGRNEQQQRRGYWQGLVAKQRRSSLSAAEFCRQHDVPPASFYGWRQRLTGEVEEAAGVCFVPLPLSQVLPSVPEFSIGLPNGVEVRVPPGFDEAALARLLQWLARWSAELLNLSHQTRVFLCSQRVDLRKSFRGLCQLAESLLEQDPAGGIGSCFSTAAPTG